MLSGFTTLSFDCYGTLIDWERGLLDSLQPWLRRRGKTVDDEELLAAFAAAESAVQARTPDKLYPDVLADAMGELARRFGVDANAEERAFFAGSAGDWPPFPDSAPALGYLKRHYRLVVLSNVDRASFARSQARLGVEFDAVYTAQDIGTYKPDPNNFRYMLERLRALGIAPAEILHVAQSLYHDHVPAKAVGLVSVWVNRRAGRAGGGATPPASAKADWEVPSLAALVEMHRREVGARG